jgi:threonine dehydratase
MTAEILRERPDVETIVVAVGGGSQAVGAMTVIRALKPDVRVYGVQAEGAPAIHDAWHRAREQGRRGEAVPRSATTFADGLATRSVYEATFPSLCEGLAGFITVTEREIAAALRLLLRTTHNLAEGAGAASLAGLRKLAPALEGKVVAVVLSGSNIDQATLRRILLEEI